MNLTNLSNNCGSADPSFLDSYPIILPSSMEPVVAVVEDDNEKALKQATTTAMFHHHCTATNCVETPLQKLLWGLPGTTMDNNHTTTMMDLGNLWQDLLMDAPHGSNNNDHDTPCQTAPTVSPSSSASSLVATPANTTTITPDTTTTTSIIMDEAPHPYDVLCVRGRGHFKHPGNVRFRQLVKQYVPQYMQAHKRVDRSVVIDALIHKVLHYDDDDEPVRLLKWSKTSRAWQTLDMNQTRDKVGHALRDAVHELHGFRLPKPN